MLQKLKIENFKSLKIIDIELSNLNLITGINGMGKSSILQVLLLLRQTFEHNLIKKSLWLNNEKYIEIGSAKNAIYRKADNDSIKFEITENDINYFWKYKYSSEIIENNYIPLYESENIDDSLENLPLFSDNLQYLGAERIIPQVDYPSSTFDVEKRFLGKKGQFTAHFIDFYGNKVSDKNSDNSKIPVCLYDKNIAISLDNDGEILPLRRQLEAWMSLINTPMLIITNYNSVTKRYELKYQFIHNKQKSDEFSALNVAFGLTYVLPVVTALVSAHKGDLIIIENPESHLHPKGQSKLGELIALVANAGVQIIIETHSDHILNGIRIVVKKQKIDFEKVKIYFSSLNPLEQTSNIENVKINKNAKLSSTQNALNFFDQMDIDLDILLS